MIIQCELFILFALWITQKISTCLVLNCEKNMKLLFYSKHNKKKTFLFSTLDVFHSNVKYFEQWLCTPPQTEKHYYLLGIHGNCINDCSVSCNNSKCVQYKLVGSTVGSSHSSKQRGKILKLCWDFSNFFNQLTK